eukprot:356598-Pelagomonas_calceolata.AAC.2
MLAPRRWRERTPHSSHDLVTLQPHCLIGTHMMSLYLEAMPIWHACQKLEFLRHLALALGVGSDAGTIVGTLTCSYTEKVDSWQTQWAGAVADAPILGTLRAYNYTEGGQWADAAPCLHREDGQWADAAAGVHGGLGL